MRHKTDWETCDQCGKEITEEEKQRGCRARVTRMIQFIEPIINQEGAFCSEKCAHEWLDEALKVIYGHYNRVYDNDVDNPVTDLWGMAGPDCCTMPVRAGANP